MHRSIWVALAVSLGGLTGCGEFVTSSTRTTAIDVVGDPNDPTPDADGRSDIDGSGQFMIDGNDPVADSNPVSVKPSLPRVDPDESSESPEEPDVVGGLGTAKPVSLKSKKAPSKLPN